MLVVLRHFYVFEIKGLDFLFFKSRGTWELVPFRGGLLVLSLDRAPSMRILSLEDRIEVCNDFLFGLRGLWNFTWVNGLRFRSVEHTILLLIHLKFNYICNAIISKLWFLYIRLCTFDWNSLDFSNFQIYGKSGLMILNLSQKSGLFQLKMHNLMYKKYSFEIIALLILIIRSCQ